MHRWCQYDVDVSSREVDQYLDGLPEKQRLALEALRRTILAAVPEATECLSYGVPAVMVDGTIVAGYAAAKRHLSYFPHSGSVLAELSDDVAEYSTSKGTLRFSVDHPLPPRLVAKLIAVRRAEASA
jgi:uncharacterized protein YdhG (YjbR/CyaY superfamily)